jgi:hypothetical protein
MKKDMKCWLVEKHLNIKIIIMIKKIPYLFILMIIGASLGAISCNSKNEKSAVSETATPKIQLVKNDAEKKVDVLIDGSLFTSYIYPNTIKKPVLYPLKTAKGTKITRGFPLEPTPGERVDHPHHVGLWFNYGDVNGLDFWNNSDSIKAEKRHQYGTIVHSEITNAESGNDKAELSVVMHWNTPDNETLLVENTTFIFRASDTERIIDRITTLTAQGIPVDLTDNKEGMIAIRTTRALEHPSEKPEIFTDASGIATKVPTLNNDGVNGLYYNSRGDEGGDCWGKRAEWVNLTSTIGDEDISLVMMDHPSNVGFPTYWHARTYGLFAANPLGQKVFSNGKEELNFKLEAGASTTWKHRIIIVSGSKLDKTILDQRFTEFSAE